MLSRKIFVPVTQKTIGELSLKIIGTYRFVIFVRRCFASNRMLGLFPHNVIDDCSSCGYLKRTVRLQSNWITFRIFYLVTIDIVRGTHRSTNIIKILSKCIPVILKVLLQIRNDIPCFERCTFDGEYLRITPDTYKG